MVVPLEAQSLQALSGPAADGPDIVTGLDIADHGLDRLIRDLTNLENSAQVNVIFGVVRECNRCVGAFAEEPRDYICRCRAMAVNYVRLEFCQL